MRGSKDKYLKNVNRTISPCIQRVCATAKTLVHRTQAAEHEAARALRVLLHMQKDQSFQDASQQQWRSQMVGEVGLLEVDP